MDLVKNLQFHIWAGRKALRPRKHYEETSKLAAWAKSKTKQITGI